MAPKQRAYSARSMWSPGSKKRLLNDPRAPVSAKAYVIFYTYALQDDNHRNFLLYCYRNDLNNSLPWNLLFIPSDDISKWFPKVLFPKGPFHNQYSMDLAKEYRATFQLLFESTIANNYLCVRRSHVSGLGLYCQDEQLSFKIEIAPLLISKNIYYFLNNYFLLFYNSSLV